MPEITVDISVYCSCGEGLCNQSTSESNRYEFSITVEQCERCRNKAYEEGLDKGYEEARKEFEVE